jgi:hypothetical protein
MAKKFFTLAGIYTRTKSIPEAVLKQARLASPPFVRGSHSAQRMKAENAGSHPMQGPSPGGSFSVIPEAHWGHLAAARVQFRLLAKELLQGHTANF